MEYDTLVVVSGRPAGEVYDREAIEAATYEDALAICDTIEREAKLNGEWENWLHGPHIFNMPENEADEFIRRRTGDA